MHSALCNCDDHLCYRHFNFSCIANRAPDILLKFCHVAINAGAIKWNIRLMAAAAVKGVAARAPNAWPTGFFQLVGDAMQPANHGAIRIQDAAGIEI